MEFSGILFQIEILILRTNSKQSSSEFTPFCNYFNPCLDGLFERNNKTKVPSVEEYVKNIHNTIDIAEKNLMKAQLQMKKQADVRRRDHPFKENDLVYVTAYTY